ncbi:MAG: hypothetical protein ACAH95_17935 [Fimbriimonas sp.]
MKLNLACKRYRKLWNDCDSRELKRSEQRFLEHHRCVCDECRQFEQTASFTLDLLRSATLEPEVSLTFDERVLRRVRVQTVRESLSYWSPALVGAGIACVAIFATLQIAAMPVQPNRARLPDGEAMRTINSDSPLPSLILSKKPLRLDQ